MNRRFEVIEPLNHQFPYENGKWLDSLEISLSHTTGGISYFNNKQYPAGWYLHFTPVYIEKHDNYNTKSTILFHERSFKMFCNDAGRFTEKRFNLLKCKLIQCKEKLTELYDNKKDAELYEYVQKHFMGVK